MDVPLDPPAPDPFGLVVLRADLTIETELRALLPGDRALLVSRIPSGADVTIGTLAAMEGELARAASLFPEGQRLRALGYGCTSGASVIGSHRVTDLLRQGVETGTVHDPLSALVAACRAEGVRRLGVVTPYLIDVTDTLCAALESQGITVPHRTAFGIATEADVARIPAPFVAAQARAMRERDVDAVFLSCTNLRTLAALRLLEREPGVPVWSSNLVLARAMAGAEDHVGSR